MKTHEMIQWIKSEFEQAKSNYESSGSEYWFGRLNTLREILNLYRPINAFHRDSCEFCFKPDYPCYRCFPESETLKQQLEMTCV